MTLSSMPLQAQWTTNMNALSNIVGNNSSGAGATSVGEPSGVAIDMANGKLYVADALNNRVLRFSYPITGTSPTAERVFGQTTFTNGNANAGEPNASASTLSAPGAVAVDASGRLWVADTGNNRVLWFNNAHSIASNKPDANGALGQSAFNANTGATAQNGLRTPVALAFDSQGNLYVSDKGNHRVLRFDNPSAKTLAANNADMVFGQANYTFGGRRRGETSLFASLEPLGCFDTPGGLALDGSDNLYVADSEHNRLLRFDDAKNKTIATNLANAFFGQSSATGQTGGTAANRLFLPTSLAMDASGRLYVMDAANNRVLIFNDMPSKESTSNADVVLGQVNFTTSAGIGSGITPARFDLNTDTYFGSLAVDNTNNRLLVGDHFNFRVLQFQATSAIDASYATDHFRSRVDGSWHDVATWETFTNNRWRLSTLVPTETSKEISIFHNVTVTAANASADELTIYPTHSLTITNSRIFSITDDALATPDLLVQGTLTVQNGAELRLLNSASLHIEGLLNQNATFVPAANTTLSFLSGGQLSTNDTQGVTRCLGLQTPPAGYVVNFATNNSVTFTGTGTVQANFPAGLFTLQALSVTLPPGGQLLLNQSLDVTGQVNITGGDLDLNGSFVVLGASGLLAESGGRVKGTGFIEATATGAAGFLSGGLNVGGLGAEITTANASVSTVTVRRTHTRAEVLPGVLGIERVFAISPNHNTGLAATLVLNYLTEELASVSETGAELWRRPVPADPWTNRGGTVNAALNRITLSGIDAFSEWTMGPGNSPLPVTISALAASRESAFTNRIDWRVAAEPSGIVYKVEKQVEGERDFRQIGTVNGTGANSYLFTDREAGTASYYRIGAYSPAGEVVYSRVAYVGPPIADSRLVSVYPTLLTSAEPPELVAEQQAMGQVHWQLSLYTAGGNLVGTYEGTLPAISAALAGKMSTLRAGLYLFRFSAAGQQQVVKVVKQ